MKKFFLFLFILLIVSNCTNKNLYIKNKEILKNKESISIVRFEYFNRSKELLHDFYLQFFGATGVALSLSNPILIPPILLGSYYWFENLEDFFTEDLNNIFRETDTIRINKLNEFNEEFLKSDLNYISIYDDSFNKEKRLNYLDYGIKILMFNNKTVHIQVVDKYNNEIFIYRKTLNKNVTIKDIVNNLNIKLKDHLFINTLNKGTP